MLPAAGPVLVMHTPRLEVERAQASAMLPAPASPRAITKRTWPRAFIASRMGMLWMEITPNAACTPQCSRNWATTAPTVILDAEEVMRSEEHTSELQSPCNLV